MKRFLKLLPAIIVAAGLLAGCGKSGSDEKKYTEVYKASFSSEYPTLNYYTSYYGGVRGLMSNCIDGLIEPDRFGRYVPSLAEKWESSENDSVWTFHIRKGVKWVDHTGKDTGRTVTAHDFVSAMRYIADPGNGAYAVRTPRNLIKGMADYYWLIDDFDEGEDIGMTREEAVATFDEKVGVKALDDYTVQYRLKGSTPYFLSLIEGSVLFLPMPYDFAMGLGEDFGIDNTKLLYCGAYYIAGFERSKSIKLQANTTYWDAKKVTLKTIDYQRIPDGTTTLEMFQRGEIYECSIEAEQYLALKGTEWAKNLIPNRYSDSTNYFWQNFTSRNPEYKAFVNNANFRKAFQYAINRETIAAMREPENPKRLVRNTVVAENIIFDQNGVDYTDYEPLKSVKNAQFYNPDTARQYMKAAIAELCDGAGNIKGVSPTTVDMLPIGKFNVDGKLPLTLYYVSDSDEQEVLMAQLLQKMLVDVFGPDIIEVQIGVCPEGFYRTVLDPRNFDVFFDSLSVLYSDPYSTLGRMMTDGDENVAEYEIPQFDTLVEQAMNTMETQKRYSLFAQAETYLVKEAFVIPFISSLRGYHMTRMEEYSYPLANFGSRKYKGAHVLTRPVTLEEHKALTAAYEADRAAAFKSGK